MKVLLVTTWGTACGIAEHSRELKAAVEAADPTITLLPAPEALDPDAADPHRGDYELIHLNYQASLHSRWTAETITQVRQHRKVVVTFHDTGVPNSDQAKAICAAAAAFVVHEPYDDLDGNGRYWRMGVPDWQSPAQFGIRSQSARYQSVWRRSISESDDLCFLRALHQPVLGSIGFPFGWKNFDLLADLTADLGWALVLIAPTATAEQVQRWQTANPASYIRTDFVPQREALGLLTACDATAFPYVTHNTGQSGAILQGIAARKSVLAFSTCRQFRSLYLDPLGSHTIRWAETVLELEWALHDVPIARADAGIVALAEQDSWKGLGRKYAELYRSLVP